ncbi:MAG: ATP-binding protein [Bacillota bacterium]|nr:ATP-binding protein [Bacillota bacterium]
MQEVLSYVRRCVDDYNMIEENDRIGVGVSGGKDSVLLLAALHRLSLFYPKKFTIEGLTLDMGYESMDFSPVADFCRENEIPYTIKKTAIKEVIFDIRHEKNPCSLCAKMRRGALHDLALERGIKKVALGHHFDDAVETLLLSLFYEGRINSFLPVTFLDRKKITVIRPLLYIPEKMVRRTSKKLGLPVIFNPCPANGNTKRQEIKELLSDLERTMPGVKERVFGAMQRYPLTGWETEK